jgi:hypothetical protein
MAVKRIYVRLIENIASEAPEQQRLKSVKHAIEKMVKIQWEIVPKMDAKGGFTMAGMVADETDVEEFLKRLRESGYNAVI